MEHKIAARDARENGVDLPEFVHGVDRVVELANYSAEQMKSMKGANLAMLYGIARYGAFIGRNVVGEAREDYINDLTARYAEMLREQFEDPKLK